MRGKRRRTEELMRKKKRKRTKMKSCSPGKTKQSNQVWSLTQLYSVIFLRTAIIVQKQFSSQFALNVNKDIPPKDK